MFVFACLSKQNLHIIKTCMLMNESYHISGFDHFANSCGYTVQFRYIQTKHTRIIRVYFAYTRMSIHTHTRMYVSSLCIPIRFFIWSIVGKTRHFYGNEKRLQSEICILLKHACLWMKSIIFRVSITSQIHQQTNISLTLAWS